MEIQGVSTLSGQSNLLISPTQNWFIFDSSGSNSPQDMINLYGGIGFYENSIHYLQSYQFSKFMIVLVNAQIRDFNLFKTSSSVTLL